MLGGGPGAVIIAGSVAGAGADARAGGVIIDVDCVDSNGSNDEEE